MHFTFNGNLPARPVVAVFSDGIRYVRYSISAAADLLYSGNGLADYHAIRLPLSYLLSREGHFWSVGRIERNNGKIMVVGEDNQVLLTIHPDTPESGKPVS